MPTRLAVFGRRIALFDLIFQDKAVSAETLVVARQLRRDGFAVIDFPDGDFHKVAGTIFDN